MRPLRPLSLLALCAATPALAQTEDGTAAGQGDPEIVVTGRGLDPLPGDAAYAVTLLDRERLSTVASGRVEDALRDVAGIAQFRRSNATSAHPTSQGITLRGLGGNASSRALLLLDGVPQTDPFGGWVPFPAYMPNRLAAIRVTRGGGSGFFGPGALAGTVELESGGPDTIGPLDVNLDYGSRDSVDATGVSAVRLGGGFVSLAGEYARSDGFIPTVRSDRGPVDRAAPYEQASFATRAVVPVGPGTELQANLSAFTDRRDRGVDYTDIDSKGADASVRLVHRGDWAWSALGYLQLRQFASGFASVNAARTTVSPSLDQYNVPATGLGARFELSPPIGGGVTLRLGSDVRAVSGRTQEFVYSTSRQRLAGGDSITGGLFADASLETGGWTFDLGGRVDRWRLSDGMLREQPVAGGRPTTNQRYADRSGWEGTGRIGAAYRLGSGVTLRAAGYRGWRLPTLNELYRPYRVGADQTNANPLLRPERLWGAEGGVKLDLDPHLSAGATIFWNRLDDAIANVTLSVAASGARTMQRQNVDAVESRGAEFDLRWQDGPLSLSASYAYTDARVHGSGSAAGLDGLRPAEVAPHMASATAGWHRGDLGGSLTGRYVARQFDDDQNQTSLRPAFTLDGEASVPLGHGLALQARAENLFDARVEAGISGADIVERATPRTLWIGFRYRMR
jgi:vitamin B12 transporter